MKITHALVRFTDDNVQKIVSIKDIKKFHKPIDDKDFSTQKTYMVKWFCDDEDENSDEDTFYSANIILLGSKHVHIIFNFYICM